jgi:MFS family permease
MNREARDLMMWEHVSRVHVTTWYTVASLVAPASAFLSPHLSVPAILLAIVYGLLITLIHWQGGTHQAAQRKGTIGLLYVALAAGPFILVRFVFSLTGWPLLPAILAAYPAPLLLLVVGARRAPLADPGWRFLDTLSQSRRLLYKGLMLVNSLFIGYGLPILGIYLYAWLTRHVFGPLVLDNLGVLLLLGGMIAGLIFGVTQRRPKTLRYQPQREVSKPSFPASKLGTRGRKQE